MNLLQIDTPAVVKWDLNSIAASVKGDIESALSIAPCEANLPALRGARAQLNKDHRNLDESCNVMRDQFMAPFAKFKEDYDTKVTAEYRNADDVLKAEISAIEEDMKAVRAERILDHIEKVVGTRDASYLPKITLSASDKSLTEAADALIKARNFASAPISEKVYIFRGDSAKIESVRKYAETVGVTVEEVE